MAQAAGDELDAIDEEFGTAAIRAAAEWSHGLADLTAGDAGAAALQLRAACQLWSEIDCPYEAAKARIALAEAFVAEGDREAAAMELRSARTAFERLGATLDADRVDQLLRSVSIGAPGERALRTFVFTDIVGSTSLLEAIGDEAWSASAAGTTSHCGRVRAATVVRRWIRRAMGSSSRSPGPEPRWRAPVRSS